MSDFAINDIYDTFLNIVAFAFIGLLVWLYFKDFTKDGAQPSERRKQDD